MPPLDYRNFVKNTLLIQKRLEVNHKTYERLQVNRKTYEWLQVNHKTYD